jgi:hypothetical protein
MSNQIASRNSIERGITDHLMFEAFERCLKHCRKIGFPEFDAYRSALAIAFATTQEFTIDQAWEAADALMSDLPITKSEDTNAD